MPIRWPNPEDERKEARPGPEGAAGRGRARDLGLRAPKRPSSVGQMGDASVGESGCPPDGMVDVISRAISSY